MIKKYIVCTGSVGGIYLHLEANNWKEACAELTKSLKHEKRWELINSHRIAENCFVTDIYLSNDAKECEQLKRLEDNGWEWKIK